jgi:K(+)-stimulated pyrophosphate-energized sodium pump
VQQALGSAAGTFSLSIDRPNVLVGLIIGGAVVFMFAGLLIRAVGPSGPGQVWTGGT